MKKEKRKEDVMINFLNDGNDDNLTTMHVQLDK